MVFDLWVSATEFHERWNLRVILLYDWLAWEPPTDGCTTVTICSAVRTSELDYTVAALINWQSMNSTMHMTLDECDLAYMMIMTELIWCVLCDCVKRVNMVRIWDDLHVMTWIIWHMTWTTWQTSIQKWYELYDWKRRTDMKRFIWMIVIYECVWWLTCICGVFINNRDIGTYYDFTWMIDIHV